MKLQEIKKENLSKTIIRALGEYILNNKLKSGDRLPTEQKIAEDLNVSRSAVREALKVLEFIGLVKSKQRTGTVLTSNGVEPFMLPYIFGIILEDTELNHIIQLRLTFEQGAARQAVLMASDEELEILMKMAKELDMLKAKVDFEANPSEQQELAFKENKFHQKLLELSHNPIYNQFRHLWCTFFSRVRDSGDLSRASRTGKNRSEEQITHQKIVQALMDRDEEKVVELIKNHLSYWLQNTDSLSKEMLIRLMNKS